MSWGLGAGSAAILLRWLADPSSRQLALEDLVVVVAMTGDEFAETASSTGRCNGPAMMAGSARSNNQWRPKHARHSAVSGRARGDP
ncbi:MAG: hypothetical protein ACYCTE_06240, partial [Acidimicrobiales bacterium]